MSLSSEIHGIVADLCRRTFFRSREWLLARDCASPINGLSLSEILNVDAGLATNDVYGKLVRYIESALRTFLHRVATLHVEFELYCVSANELSSCIEGQLFDRIEVSSAML